MATMLNGTTLGSARQAAEHALDSVKGGAEHALGSAKEATAGTRSALMEGLRTLNTLVAAARSLDGDDALGWLGLARRRGPVASMATFGAGMVVGAGVALLFAPMSGAETRRKILGLFQGAKEGAAGTVDRPRSDLDERVGDAEAAVDTRTAAAPPRAYGADGSTHH
jgi:hypothetical protein